jgi:hypothetical protein
MEELARWMPKGAPVEPLALFRTLAKHLPLAQAMLPLGKYLLGRNATLGIRERELVIQRVCARLGCEYEWGVHATFFGAPAGIDDKTMKATVLGRPDDKAWKGVDSLLVRVGRALGRARRALHTAATARAPRARRLVPRDRLRRERRRRTTRELGGALSAAVVRRSTWT